MGGRSKGLWLSNLVIQVDRGPVQEPSSRGPLVNVVGHDAWLTRMAFIGDAGPVQGVLFQDAARGYVAGAHPHPSPSGARLRSQCIDVGLSVTSNTLANVQTAPSTTCAPTRPPAPRSS